MKSYYPFIIFLIMMCYLSWVRRGHGGKIGAKIRASDWWAWKQAVEYIEREIEILRKNEPPYKTLAWDAWLVNLRLKKFELELLKLHEPKK